MENEKATPIENIDPQIDNPLLMQSSSSEVNDIHLGDADQEFRSPLKTQPPVRKFSVDSDLFHSSDSIPLKRLAAVNFEQDYNAPQHQPRLEDLDYSRIEHKKSPSSLKRMRLHKKPTNPTHHTPFVFLSGESNEGAKTAVEISPRGVNRVFNQQCIPHFRQEEGKSSFLSFTSDSKPAPLLELPANTSYESRAVQFQEQILSDSEGGGAQSSRSSNIQDSSMNQDYLTDSVMMMSAFQKDNLPETTVHSESEARKKELYGQRYFHAVQQQSTSLKHQPLRQRRKKQDGDNIPVSKRLYHPFAERPSPWEETKQAIILGVITALQFMLIDFLMNGVLYYLWKALEYTLLSPLALIGLLVDSLRIVLVKIKRRLLSDDDLVLRNDMMMPSKEFIVAIRLCGVLVDLAKEPSNDEADSQGESQYAHSHSRGSIKVFKRPRVDSFLRYLNEIKARVIIFEDLRTASSTTSTHSSLAGTSPNPLSSQDVEQIVRYLSDSIGDRKFEAVTLLEEKHQILGQIKEALKEQGRLEQSLIIIDRDPHTIRDYPKNTIQATGTLLKPIRWRQVIEQLILSKGDDVRQNLPAVIQMQYLYPQ